MYQGAFLSGVGDRVKIIKNILGITRIEDGRMYPGRSGWSGSSRSFSQEELEEIKKRNTSDQKLRNATMGYLHPSIKTGSYERAKTVLLRDVIDDIKKEKNKSGDGGRVPVVIKTDLEGSDCEVLLASREVFADDEEILVPYLLVEWFGAEAISTCSKEKGNRTAKMLAKEGKFDKIYKVSTFSC